MLFLPFDFMIYEAFNHRARARRIKILWTRESIKKFMFWRNLARLCRRRRLCLVFHVILENDWQFRCEAGNGERDLSIIICLLRQKIPGKFVREEISLSFLLSPEEVDSKMFNYDFNRIVIKDLSADARYPSISNSVTIFKSNRRKKASNFEVDFWTTPKPGGEKRRRRGKSCHKLFFFLSSPRRWAEHEIPFQFIEFASIFLPKLIFLLFLSAFGKLNLSELYIFPSILSFICWVPSPAKRCR